MYGQKVDYTSIPYSKIQPFSVETAGTLDLDCELEVDVSGLGKVRFEIRGNFAIVAFIAPLVSSCCANRDGHHCKKYVYEHCWLLISKNRAI